MERHARPRWSSTSVWLRATLTSGVLVTLYPVAALLSVQAAGIGAGIPWAALLVGPPVSLVVGSLFGFRFHPPTRKDLWRLCGVVVPLTACMAVLVWGVAFGLFFVSDTCSGTGVDPRCFDPNSSYPFPDLGRMMLWSAPLLGAAGVILGTVMAVGLAVAAIADGGASD
jgi:hypothetical protein